MNDLILVRDPVDANHDDALITLIASILARHAQEGASQPDKGSVQSLQPLQQKAA